MKPLDGTDPLLKVTSPRLIYIDPHQAFLRSRHFRALLALRLIYSSRTLSSLFSSPETGQLSTAPASCARREPEESLGARERERADPETAAMRLLFATRDALEIVQRG